MVLLVLLIAASAPTLARVGGFRADQAPAAALRMSEQPPERPSPDEFVPVSELPPEEQLPAAPLLVTAYAVAWVAVLGYLWSVWRRLGQVEHELRAVRSALERKGSQ